MTLNFAVFNDLTENYTCSRCKSKNAHTQCILNNTSETAVVCCDDCGYTEFYDYNILDKKISK